MRICILIILLFTLSGCSSNFTYIEDKVYTQNILPQYSKAGERIDIGEYLNREEAIDKAISIFKDGFNIDIDRELLYEYVELNQQKDDFIWSISFRANESEENEYSYFIRINSTSGELLEASVYYNPIVNESYNLYETYELIRINEIKEIINPLLQVININIDDYKIDIYDEYDIEIVQLLKNNNEYHIFGIDKKNKRLQSYIKGE